ncbi:MAG TPA: DUF3375 family protein [Steroidobacteraceae bacterium]|nr:DUF3375 family protein [Steroidobacteraceae bacterium]
MDRLRQVHPAWRILVADHAPLVLSFLTLALIQPNRRAIPAPEIAAHLDAYLDHLRETYPERYPRSARDYLEDWAAPNRAYLRKYYPKSGPDAEFDLTPATEKAIEWLQTLAPQQFIGTESRLLTLFQLLRDLAVGAQDDPSARIRDLTRRRDDIEREIERVPEGRAGLFGGGYAIDLVRALPWLAKQPLHYWGDLDTHGFAILSRLRQYFPHTRSFLMDRDTLVNHRDFWTEELSGTRVLRDLPTLDPFEQSLYDDLRNDRLGDRVRLEQEGVQYQRVEQAVLALHC